SIPSMVMHTITLGWCFINWEIQEAREKPLNNALRLKPGFPEAQYCLGLVYYQENRFNEAVAAYLEAIRLRPNYSEAYYNLALAYEDLQRDEDARDAYNRAVSLSPDDFLALGNLGVLLARIGKYEDAIPIW